MKLKNHYHLGNANQCQNWKTHLARSIHIDQMVYFLQYPQMTFSETYTINQVRVDNSMGTFAKVRKLQGNRGSEKQKVWFNFKPTWKNNPPTRNNLQGLHLKAVAEKQAPFMVFTNDTYKELNYFPGNDTYLLPDDYLTGSFPAIVRTLQKKLNFTMSVYKR